jgi:site-specific DNA-methyltransferase (adenine-specific)
MAAFIYIAIPPPVIILNSYWTQSFVQGGEFQNEIVWNYSGWSAKLAHQFNWRHDVIFFYGKAPKQKFNSYRLNWGSEAEYLRLRKQKLQVDSKGKKYVLSDAGKGQRVKRYLEEAMAYGQPVDDVWPIDKINNSSSEGLGYPTQKPEALLERIIAASSNEGDTVLDVYCGCGTTIAVAQRLKRRWIGMDITYQSISLMLRRLEKAFGSAVSEAIKTDGIPRDMASARALAHKKDDRLRKEFEKWAVLTYTNNRAEINDKKGADKGIDGIGYFLTAKNENAKIVFQVKSRGVQRGDIAKLSGDMRREKAELAVLITLEEPSGPMVKEAKGVGHYRHEVMGHNYDRIGIVTVREIIEGGKRLDIPMSQEVVAAAKLAIEDTQTTILFK